ncbi:MAG TPA: PIN domain-containing protein [Dehalococcoidia bacterium]|nr:PIN domain-containing protein [Dehalococcoidia bacterium]
MPALRIDSNTILRYLVNDAPQLAVRAIALFERVASGEERVLLEDVVLAEVIWTLTTFYRATRVQIHDYLDPILDLDGVENGDKQALQMALVFYRDRHVDFVDALLAAKAIRAGSGELYTFDRDFDRLPGVARRDPGSPA